MSYPEPLEVDAPSEATIAHVIAVVVAQTLDIRRYKPSRGVALNLFEMLGKDGATAITQKVTETVNAGDSPEDFATKYAYAIDAAADVLADAYAPDIEKPRGYWVGVMAVGLANTLRGVFVEYPIMDELDGQVSKGKADFVDKIDGFAGDLTYQIKPAASKKKWTDVKGEYDILAVYEDLGDDKYTVHFEVKGDEYSGKKKDVPDPAWMRARDAAK